jgi:muconolactone D-isomerase
MEFLVRIDVTWPAGLDEATKARLTAAESARGRELGEAGVIRAMWRVPGRLSNIGIWAAADADELHAAITSLPLWPFMEVDVSVLATHYLAPWLSFACGPRATLATPVDTPGS